MIKLLLVAPLVLAGAALQAQSTNPTPGTETPMPPADPGKEAPPPPDTAPPAPPAVPDQPAPPAAMPQQAMATPPAPPPPAPASYPRCSATVQDECVQGEGRQGAASSPHHGKHHGKSMKKPG